MAFSAIQPVAYVSFKKILWNQGPVSGKDVIPELRFIRFFPHLPPLAS